MTKYKDAFCILSIEQFKKMEADTSSLLDYFLFILMLVSDAVVGIYYGFFNKQNTAQDYLLGDKQMNVWLVAMSQI